MGKGRPSGRSARSRGEVNEVINRLEQLSALDGRKPDVVTSKRECFQKLIKYMTAGIDMSAAFIPATKCVALSKADLPLKKMLYLYLRSAARQNEAVALLVVQTLLTDAKDADPAIRGLAVRSICSLRVPDLMENVFAAVDAGLRDAHPYVRESAVVGVLKCAHQDLPGTKMRGYLDALRAMLASDTDPQVVANCLYVLSQLGSLGPAAINRPLVVSLLNHIRAFSDWAQCLVLEVLLAHYRPGSEAERFDMLEVLDFGLNHTNSAVVMATAKLFLHYTSNYPDQHAQVLASIRGPLQTLLLGREPEIVYAALANLVVLAQRHPAAFADLAPDFFYRPEDPTYLKLLKLEALVAVAAPANAFDAAEEATQYARDADGDVARGAVRCVSRIAAKAVEVDGVLDRLLLFLGHARIEVADEAVAAVADVLRRFPDAAPAYIATVAEVDEGTLESPAARAALVWVLGEFGHSVQDAPYTLEGLARKFTAEAPEVRAALLTAVAKLFFRRPPECRIALGLVLAAGVEDADPGVKDRAQLYYRLLRDAGPEAAAAVIAAPRPAAAGKYEDGQSAEVRDRIFDEWNSLSVVYRAPAATFIDLGEGAEWGEAESIGGGDDVLVEGEAAGGSMADTALLLDLENGGVPPSEAQETPTAALSTSHASKPISSGSAAGGAADSSVSDLLAMCMYSSPGGAPPAAAAAVTANSSSSGLSSLAALGGMLASSPAAAAPAAPIQQQQSSEFDSLEVFFGGGGNGNAGSSAAPPPTAAAAPLASHTSSGVQGSDLEDFFGGLGGSTATTAAPAAAAEEVALLPCPAITATEFQAEWSQHGAAGGTSTTFHQPLSHSGALGAISGRGFKDFTDHVAQAHIASLATPKEGAAPPLRFLLHARRIGGSGARVLVQVTISGGGGAALAADVDVRSADAAAAQHVKALMQDLLLTI